MPAQRGGLPVGILGGSFLAPLGGGRRHKFRTMKRKGSGRKSSGRKSKSKSRKTRKSAEPWWKVW